MKILHIINNLNTGGAELVLARLLSAPVSSSYHHAVLSLGPEGPVADLLRAAGIPLSFGGMRADASAPRALRRCLHMAHEGRPDLIVAWLYHSCLFAELSAATARQRPPVVWAIHHSLATRVSTKRTTRAVFTMLRCLSNRPALILYPSEAAARQHERAGFAAAATRVIPNGYDVARFAPVGIERRRQLRLRMGLDDGAVLIGMVARFHPDKGHALLFGAAARLFPQYPLLELVLAGRGVDPANADLMRQLAAHGIAQRTHCLGERTDPTAVAGIYQALDVYVSSSRTESFNGALAESMACGVPAVATDVSDPARILGAAGQLVPAGNPEALAQAIDEMLRRSAADRQALGRLARERIVSNFSLAAMAREYEQMYDSLLGGRGRIGTGPV